MEMMKIYDCRFASFTVRLGQREREKVSRHAEWYAIKMQIVLLPKGLS